MTLFDNRSTFLFSYFKIARYRQPHFTEFRKTLLNNKYLLKCRIKK